LLAGADRVEGCLFGNGERTGGTATAVAAVDMVGAWRAPTR
ncbi:MAG: hypothetical protein JWP76_496, partial [Dactylosporangium sp.]|nr:hypothetical protein [Dactylosporangium sp.]